MRREVKNMPESEASEDILQEVTCQLEDGECKWLHYCQNDLVILSAQDFFISEFDYLMKYFNL